MNLDLGRWICMVLVKRLAAASVYISREVYMGDFFQHQSTGYLRTRGQKTLYETCHSH